MRGGLLVAVLFGMVVLAGCTQQVSGTAAADPEATVETTTTTSSSPPPETTTEPPDPLGEPELDDFVGVWEGTYTCGTSQTGLRLTIEPPQGEALSTVLEFFPLPQSPEISPGSFRMTGRINVGIVGFLAGDWIERPPDYLTVNLLVFSPPTAGAPEFSGIVDGAGCSLFQVSRV